MGTQQKAAFCRTCGRDTLHVKTDPSPGFMAYWGHGVLVVLTCGLWLLVMVPWALWQGVRRGAARFRCQACGGAA